MRKMTMLAACSMLALAPAAHAQTQAPATPPPAAAPESPQAPAAAPTIQKVNVVDLQELTPEEQTKVNEVTSKTSESDLQNLRKSIDANPQVSAALQAEGLTSATVIAVAMAADGTLTVITRKG